MRWNHQNTLLISRDYPFNVCYELVVANCTIPVSYIGTGVPFLY
jgi:hypothetical protein